MSRRGGSWLCNWRKAWSELPASSGQLGDTGYQVSGKDTAKKAAKYSHMS